MANKKETTKPATKSKSRIATTIEARTNQAISIATDLALAQLKDGTATSQVICHFLKLGTAQAQLDLEKTKRENKLLEVKAEAIDSGKKLEELYSNAIKAMRNYQGVMGDDTEEEQIDIQ